MFTDNIKYIAYSLFDIIEPVIEILDPPSATGRPRADTAKTFYTIFRKLKTGDPWHSFDNHIDFVSGSTANDRHIKWSRIGVYDVLDFLVARLYHKTVGYRHFWQSVDATKCQAPVRGERLNTEGRGRNPTDRGFQGTKISMQVDQRGAPLGLVVTGANVHDAKLLEDTIKDAQKKIMAIFGDKNKKMHLCLDKGYFGQPCEVISFINGFTAHIRSRGEEKEEKEEGKKPRRWVVEQTFANLKSYHAIRTRYCRKLKNYIGFVRLATIHMLFKRIQKVMNMTKIRSIVDNDFISKCISDYIIISCCISSQV